MNLKKQIEEAVQWTDLSTEEIAHLLEWADIIESINLLLNS